MRADWYAEDLLQLNLMREAKMHWNDIARQMSRRKNFEVTATACKRAHHRLSGRVKMIGSKGA